MTVNQTLIGLIRTVVTAAVGIAATWLAKHLGVPIDSTAVAGPVALAAIGGYYTAVRTLEKRWPWVGWLLGYKASVAFGSNAKAVRRKIAETVVPGKRLGRHVHHDPRSRLYPAPTAGTLVSVMHQTVGLPLDQGDVGSCTANALIGVLNSAPNDQPTPHPRTEADAQALYHEETVEEGSPWPPNDPGGTGIAVCKAAEKLGLGITSYTHTFNLQDALAALVLRPVIIGINWYTSFDTPGPDGMVSIGKGATVRGGHEVLVYGLDVDKRVVYCMNSWGPGWGFGGTFLMSWDTLGQLLAEQGDVTVPIVNAPVPTPTPGPAPGPTPTPTPTPGPAPTHMRVTLTDPAVIAHIERNAPRHGESNDAYAEHTLAKAYNVT